ncbi:MAG: carboxypeptidase-like regulatory domain-containing protein [Pyrinomonadaceae bacterium]
MTPVRVNHTFDRSNWTITTPSDDTVANFTAFLNDYSIAGRVLDSTGQGLSGAIVTLSGSESATATSTAGGNYSFTVPAEGNYSVSVAKVHYRFVPPSTSLVI